MLFNVQMCNGSMIGTGVKHDNSGSSFPRGREGGKIIGKIIGKYAKRFQLHL